MQRADADFDLPTARRAALAAVEEDPTGADAVAAAGWWLNQIGNLPEPEEILSVAGDVRDPELGFLLARIESGLNGRPPSGSLATAELAGPFGVFDILDLERGVAPPRRRASSPQYVVYGSIGTGSPHYNHPRRDHRTTRCGWPTRRFHHAVDHWSRDRL